MGSVDYFYFSVAYVLCTQIHCFTSRIPSSNAEWFNWTMIFFAGIHLCTETYFIIFEDIGWHKSCNYFYKVISSLSVAKGYAWNVGWTMIR